MLRHLLRRPSWFGLIGAVMLIASTWATGLAAATGSSKAPAASSIQRATIGARAGQPAQLVRLHRHVVHLSIQNFAFNPQRLVVSRGTKFVWTNQDNLAHTVTSDKGIWDSGPLNPNAQFVRVFKKAGTFKYHCTIHPFMHGTITVKA